MKLKLKDIYKYANEHNIVMIDEISVNPLPCSKKFVIDANETFEFRRKNLLSFDYKTKEVYCDIFISQNGSSERFARVRMVALEYDYDLFASVISGFVQMAASYIISHKEADVCAA